MGTILLFPLAYPICSLSRIFSIYPSSKLWKWMVVQGNTSHMGSVYAHYYSSQQHQRTNGKDVVSRRLQVFSRRKIVVPCYS